MGTGKLYDIDGKHLVAVVHYILRKDPPTWGEFICADEKVILAAESCILELNDGRRGIITIKRSLMPRLKHNYYQFQVNRPFS